MKKQIRITLADGRVYGIDADKVAHDKAKDCESQEDSYDIWYSSILANDAELEEWLHNNMNWYELEPVLLQHFLKPIRDCDIESTEIKRVL